MLCAGKPVEEAPKYRGVLVPMAAWWKEAALRPNQSTDGLGCADGT